MIRTAELPRPSNPESTLRYSSSGDARWVDDEEMLNPTPELVELRTRDPGLYDAAWELSACLMRDYRDGYQQALDSMNVPPAVRGFLAERGMDHPRVGLLSYDQAVERLEAARQGWAPATEDGDGEEYDDHDDRMEMYADSVVVNFRLPKPLQQFWHAREWGDIYRGLMHIPWWTLDDWKRTHSEFEFYRLNPVGDHSNARDDGYYYLFAIARSGAKTAPDASGRTTLYDEYEDIAA